MLTQSHNDRCPEMAATVRRGPLAKPTDEDRHACSLPLPPIGFLRGGGVPERIFVCLAFYCGDPSLPYISFPEHVGGMGSDHLCSEEMIEYLLTRKKREQDAVKVGHHSLEHVLSYQRRIQVTKSNFLRRGCRTPLGILQDG